MANAEKCSDDIPSSRLQRDLGSSAARHSDDVFSKNVLEQLFAYLISCSGHGYLYGQAREALSPRSPAKPHKDV